MKFLKQLLLTTMLATLLATPCRAVESTACGAVLISATVDRGVTTVRI
ncbi:MAG: hypothetical protein LBJ95_05305 [Oscillospiraceae bacterium]|nr:hypothetical protein [Oscillospiraceae bacterium]